MKKNNITVVNNITTSAPKFKIGDTIYWYCDKEQRTHHARVKYLIMFILAIFTTISIMRSNQYVVVK